MRNRLLADCWSARNIGSLPATNTNKSNTKVSTTTTTNWPSLVETNFIATNNERLINLWLPHLNWLQKFYYLLSNAIHITNIVASLTIIFLDDQRHHGTRRWLACYLPRLIVHEAIGTYPNFWLGILISGLHLSWRLLMIGLGRRFVCQSILLLLMDESEIEAASDEESARHFYRNYKLMHPIQSVLFYKIEDVMKNSVRFVMRPSRTREARADSMRSLDASSKRSLWIFSIACLIFLVNGFRAFFTQLDKFYPGCDSPDSAGTRIIIFLWRFLSCAAVSLVTLVDSMFALAASPLIGTILVRDLNVYWAHVMRELRRLARDLRLSRKLAVAGHKEAQASLRQRRWKLKMSTTGGDGGGGGGSSSSLPRLRQRKFELQTMFCDFFGQLHQADGYISIFHSFALLAWLVVNAVLTFTGLQPIGWQGGANHLIRTTQLAGLCVVILLSLRLLTVKRSSEAAYIIIASLMAHDVGLDKKRWLVVLKYYTGRPRHAFTLFRTKIFTLGILLKTLFYTLTVFFFLESKNLTKTSTTQV